MKGTRLKDVLDDKVFNKDKWNIIFGKLKRLGTAIEMYYGSSMDIDNLDYRWVDDRIKHFDERKRLLTKEEMTIANNLWKKYHPTKNI
tara:strand:- start:44 stop:307 length:264 start_codon:yes stop_codon:yes gene_type:complete